MTDTATIISDAQIAQYHREGWCLLPEVIPPELLEVLRRHAGQVVADCDAAMDADGVDVRGINIRGKRYFSINPSFTWPALYGFILSDLMRTIAGALLGPEVWTFWEQYVIKGADGGSSFAWHQDSAYVGFEHPRYLTCWCALDDMSEANGTARILPFGRGADRLVPHQQDPATNDLIGYDGDDPGIPVVCPAGSIACFTSHTLHSSGINDSPALRRVYLIQYSDRVLQAPGDYKPYGRSEPVLHGGAPVLQPTLEA